MYYIPIIELPVLVMLVLARSLVLRRQGIKALVFGVTDKSDFLIIPVIAFFFYSLLAGIFNFPYPKFLTASFWKTESLQILMTWIAIFICTASLVWFAVTLKIFGSSFRVGIDEKTNGKLVTNGTFAFSRNPVYLAFITFFTGIFLAYSGFTIAVFLVLLFMAIHRQILREEIFLKNHYGKEYEEYCRKTRRYL